MTPLEKLIGPIMARCLKARDASAADCLRHFDASRTRSDRVFWILAYERKAEEDQLLEVTE